MAKKEQGQSIGGAPDDWDEKNIQEFLTLFEQSTISLPNGSIMTGKQIISKMRIDVETEMALSDTDKFATISKDSDMRKAFWLPDQFSAILEVAYPSLWTNPAHTRWFIRKFPIFSFENARRKVKP